MGKQHQASRRRSYGRRQHGMNEQAERYTRVVSWLDDADPFDSGFDARADLLARRAAETWLRIIGLD
jgi:hypothetical protein